LDLYNLLIKKPHCVFSNLLQSLCKPGNNNTLNNKKEVFVRPTKALLEWVGLKTLLEGIIAVVSRASVQTISLDCPKKHGIHQNDYKNTEHPRREHQEPRQL
jgi:hypothetical protein